MAMHGSRGQHSRSHCRTVRLATDALLRSAPLILQGPAPAPFVMRCQFPTHLRRPPHPPGVPSRDPRVGDRDLDRLRGDLDRCLLWGWPGLRNLDRDRSCLTRVATFCQVSGPSRSGCTGLCSSSPCAPGACSTSCAGTTCPSARPSGPAAGSGRRPARRPWASTAGPSSGA